MPNVTAICYFCSLLFYGIGYSKTLLIKNAVVDNIDTFDYSIQVSLATGCFVLAIFFTVIGSVFFFYLKNNREQETIELHNVEFRVKADRRLDAERSLVSISEVKAQLAQSDYGLDLHRRLSS